MTKQITQTMRLLNITNYDRHKEETMDKDERNPNIYCNVTKNTSSSEKHYTILKEDEFDGFCLESGATRTLVGKNNISATKRNMI